MIKIAFFVFTIFLSLDAMTQDTNPNYFEQIPDAPESYTEFTTMARLVDGLGFRYYWATEGLRDEDLSYKPSESGRTTREVLEHIYSLSRTTSLTVQGETISRTTDQTDMDFETLRNETLAFLQIASERLRSENDRSMDDLKIKFQRGENVSEFPFWNMINGPIADAIWHCGQIVSNRRASGNPFNSNVSVFSGKKRS